jgi:hypothetical protein
VLYPDDRLDLERCRLERHVRRTGLEPRSLITTTP